MVPMSERVVAPVSTAELERRWTAVRKEMAHRKIDVLLMQNNNDFQGGAVKYFTDLPATNGYPFTVVFPRDDLMTTIGQGPLNGDQTLPPGGDGVRRGIKRALSTPSFVTAGYSVVYDAELAAKALEPYAKARVGIVGMGYIPYAFLDYLKRGALAGADIVDATGFVDEIRAVKSAEEIAAMFKSCNMQDAMMKAVFNAAAPGMTDLELVGVAKAVGAQWGSEQGWYMAASGPLRTPAVMAPPHQQNRKLRAGEQFTILLENSGPGGFYTELGRTCVLGKATQEMKDEFAFVLEARRFTLAMMKDGAEPKIIWDEFNAFMRRNKRPEEKRLYAHSQGYDMVERPLIRFDETMRIRNNMVLAVHPTYVTERTYSWACDNFLIDAVGATRMHEFPEKITELE